MSTCNWTNEGEVWTTECGREQESALLAEAKFCCFCGNPITGGVPHQYPITEGVILTIDDFIDAYRTGTLDAMSLVFITREKVGARGWISSDGCHFPLLKHVNRQRQWLMGEVE